MLKAMQQGPISAYEMYKIENSIVVVVSNLKQNSIAVKKVCGPQECYCEKKSEIQSGSQEMAVMIGKWQKFNQVNLHVFPSPSFTRIRHQIHLNCRY